jgi:hypothetical protein
LEEKVDCLTDWLIDRVDGVKRLRTAATNGLLFAPRGGVSVESHGDDDDAD